VKYFAIEPEVAGGLGRDTVLDRSTHPPVVTKLHYEFQGWLGDEVVESFPCYLISTRLRDVIKKSRFSGVKFSDATVTTSPEFQQLHPDATLPEFVWLQVVGKPGKDDFGISADHRLVASERAFNALALQHLASVEDYSI